MGSGAKNGFLLLPVLQLLAMTEPEWLIKSVIPEKSLTAIYRQSGEGKSFVGLDMALSVAAGLPWQGFEVRPGAVIYVAAEGGGGIQRRVHAWMQVRQQKDIPEAFFILDSVHVTNADELTQLIETIREMQLPGVQLVVIDTLARCFVGDENTAQDMGKFIDGLNRLQTELDTAVAVVHHTGKNGEAERGSSALRAATDVMLYVTMNKGDKTITIKNNKQKDAEECRDVKLQLQQVDLGSGSTSCVLTPTSSQGSCSKPTGRLPQHLKQTLGALPPCRTERPPRRGCAATGQPDRTLHGHRKALVRAGYVEAVAKGRYRLTDAGRSALPTAATATVM